MKDISFIYDKIPKDNSSFIEGRDPQNRPIISLLLFREYEISPEGECSPTDTEMDITKQMTITTYQDEGETITYKAKVQPSLVKEDCYVYPWKSYTDLVVQGIIRTEPTSSLTCSFICEGPKVPGFSRSNLLKRNVLVTGDRWVERKSNGKLVFSEPQIFEEMPFRYDKAYGGSDEVAGNKDLSVINEGYVRAVEQEKSLKTLDEPKEYGLYSYPRNPAGKGYIIDPIGSDGLELPNLEFPEQLITPETLVLPQNHWGERPQPACFDWFSHACFPRSSFFWDFQPTHDNQIPFPERDWGIFEHDFLDKPLMHRSKAGFFQGSNPFFWRERLQGGERIKVNNMSDEGENFIVELPKKKPLVQVALFSEELKPVPNVELDTVFIRAEESKLIMTWRASFHDERQNYILGWEGQCSSEVVWPEDIGKG